MSRSPHSPGASPPRSNGKHRRNHKPRDRLPLGERTDELLPRVLRVLCASLRSAPAYPAGIGAAMAALAVGHRPAAQAPGQAPALAATIDVDGTNCTLADAIRSANTNTAVGGCTKGSGADTIVLPTGSTQSLTAVDNTTHGPTGLPVIRSAVTIQGRNSTIQRESSAPEFRILAVASSGDLTLHYTTVTGAEYYGGVGGGIANFDGALTLTNSMVSGNSCSLRRRVQYRYPHPDQQHGLG